MKAKSGLQILLSVTGTALAVYFQSILIPVLLLVVMMAVDYISGVCAAWNGGRLSSRIGIVGIVKKAGYLMVITVGMAVDYMVARVADEVGLTFTAAPIFGLMVTVWMILNECISILENLTELDVPIPLFLKRIIDRLAKTAEEEAGIVADSRKTDRDQ